MGYAGVTGKEGGRGERRGEERMMGGVLMV